MFCIFVYTFKELTMKKLTMKKLLLLGVLSSVLFVGCKKTTTPTPTNQTSVSARIKTMKYDSGSPFTYSYDASGRLTRADFDDSSYTMVEYTSASLITLKEFKNNLLNSTYKITLNTQGYGIYVENVGSKKIDTNYFDANGFRLYEKNQVNIVENGNVTKRIFGTDTTYYTYDLTKLNTIGNSNMGSPSDGKDNQNLVISSKYGAKSLTYTQYSYEFDAKNRVVKMISSYYNNGVKSQKDYITLYTYTD